MSAQWRIQLLGELRVAQGNRTVTRFDRRKAGALLAYLAYFLDRAHPRDALVEMLWPESDIQRGRQSLSQVLYSLRQQLEPPGTEAGVLLSADHASLRLNPTAVTTDVAEFESALHAAKQATGATERLRHLVRGVELYRGELLPGLYQAWILPEQQRLGELYFQAIRQVIRHLEEDGDLHGAIQHACAAVGADRLREEAHAELIRLYVAMGQPGAAVRKYRELERLFQQELGQSPSTETRDLVRAVEAYIPNPVRQAPRAAPVAPEAPTSSARPASELPVGTVTFLLTDIQRSTAAWQQLGDAFKSALVRHHALLRQEFQRHGGHEVQESGDGFLVAFQSAGDALACAVAAQRALADRGSVPSDDLQLKVRMALHTGEVELEEGEYRGLVLHHASRMLLAAHGGQILCSDLTAGLLQRDARHGPEPGPRFTDLGVFRLRDLPAPERLLQVNYPEMEQWEFPPLNAEAAYTSSLPLQLTRFFGREEEIVRLLELLSPAPRADSAGSMTPRRLVTLTGPGGSGKSRLARIVAGRLLEPFHDAVWFVPLADLADPERIPDAVRDALRLPRSADVEPLEQVVAALTQRSQPALLVLDNFEHLVTEGTPLVRTLLERIPSLTCLVASRQRLRLVGEREFVVPPLPVPGIKAAQGPELRAQGGDKPYPEPCPVNLEPSALLQYPSVQLFVDRAQAVRPDFQVTEANATVVAEICRRLEGIPLALELAAARAQVLTPLQILSHLENRFGFLVSRQRDLEPRQRSLRAALDWSYQLLSPELQRFFRWLTVFRGGWSLEAAETVCMQPVALDYLEQLRECSLIQVEETGDEIRYRLLEALREYGWDRLVEAGEVEAARQQHRDWFLSLVEEAEPELLGGEQGTWLVRLETEHDNLRAALVWAEESGEPEPGLRLAGALWEFWASRGHLAEGRARVERLLALALPNGESGGHGEALRAARAKALACAGVLADFQGDFTAARAFHREGLAIRRELGDPWGTAFSLTALGFVAQHQSDYAAARAFSEEALTFWQALENDLGTAWSLNCLADVSWHEGDYATARGLFEQSLALRRGLGDPWGAAFALSGLGTLALHQGDLEAARGYHEQSLALRRDLGDQRGIATSVTNLGHVAMHQGHLELAQVLLREGLTIQRDLGDKGGIAESLYVLGRVAHGEGELEAAGAHLAESLALWRDLGAWEGMVVCLEGLAAVTAAAARRLPGTGQGGYRRAARLFGAAKAQRGAEGAPLPPVDCWDYDRTVSALRAALGEEACAAAWAEGGAMTLEQAVEYALEGAGQEL